MREALGCGARRCNARGREVLGVERGGGANGRVRSAGCRARRCEGREREVLGVEHGGAKGESAKCGVSSTEVARSARARSAGASSVEVARRERA